MSGDGGRPRRENGHLPERTRARSFGKGSLSGIGTMEEEKKEERNSLNGNVGREGAGLVDATSTVSTIALKELLGAATTVADVRSALQLLDGREQSVTARLDGLLRSQSELRRDLGRLDVLRAHLGTQVVAARAVGNGMLSAAAGSGPRRIASQVKQIDMEQERVRETLKVVEQVAELKACVLGVTGSMGAPQDWETAARYLQRASKIPESVITGPFAERVVPSAEVPDPPSVTLNNAAESLCGLFLREFERAITDGESAKITRFFKLFPLIGRSDVGLDVYGRYVCQGVASRARANLNPGTGGVQATTEGFFYSNALTKLFEHIAQIVDGHRALVERHYDSGAMIKVIGRLQVEVDVQGGIIIETWMDERGIERKLTDIKSYAFSFLLQSFIDKGSTDRVGGAAKKEAKDDDEGIETKDIDAVLKEAATMLSRWSLYCRFIATVCAPSEGQVLVMPALLTKSLLLKRVTENLVRSFNEMTTFYVRRSVEKAFQLDESYTPIPIKVALFDGPPSSQYITSAVDDTMFIVREVLARALATSQRVVVATAAGSIDRVLCGDFLGMVQRKMRHEVNPQVTPGQGPLHAPIEKIQGFLILMNNLDVAMNYIKMIIRRYTSDTSTANGSLPGNDPSADASPDTPSLPDMFPFEQDAAAVLRTLQNLESHFLHKASELLNEAIKHAHEHILRPALRPLLGDAFRDMDYMVTPEILAARARLVEDLTNDSSAGPEDAVRIRFEHGWQPAIAQVKTILTESNFSRVISITASIFAKLLERKVWSYDGRINELGGIHLERDVTSVISAVVRTAGAGASTAASGRASGSIREMLSRVTQICMVMNMEEDEWQEVLEAEREGGEGASGIEWKLDSDERVRAREMIKQRSS